VLELNIGARGRRHAVLEPLLVRSSAPLLLVPCVRGGQARTLRGPSSKILEPVSHRARGDTDEPRSPATVPPRLEKPWREAECRGRLFFGEEDTTIVWMGRQESLHDRSAVLVAIHAWWCAP
jgi:hypothetical protein